MTSATKTLRILILAMWSAAIVGAALDLALESRLPEPLRNYLAAQWENDLTFREGVGLVAGLVALLFMIRGSVQLYRLRANGRRPFLIGTIIGILVTPAFGPFVSNAWAYMFYGASITIGGVIIGWTWLSSDALQLISSSSGQGSQGQPPPIA